MAILLVLGRPFISFVYGLEYVGAYEILAIMLIGVIGMIFYKMVYSYNVVNGKRMINFLFLGGAAIINIIGNYFLIPIGGIAAAAWSSVISYLICGICFLLYFCHIEKVKLHEMLIIQKSDFSSFKNLIKNII
jgi:O-antigen/teichoic acid export membrane protein